MTAADPQGVSPSTTWRRPCAILMRSADTDRFFAIQMVMNGN